jgi:outer membrane autotransporter protein
MLTPIQREAQLWKAWASGYASRSGIDADPAAGSGKSAANDNGSVVGLERMLGGLRIGTTISIGQGASTFGDQSARVESDHRGVGVYASVAFGSVTLDTSAMHGWSDESSRRDTSVGTVKGEFSTQNTQLGFGLSCGLLPAGRKWQLTPVARLKFFDYAQDAFEETGTGLAFRSGRVQKDTFLSKIGLKVDRRGELNANIDFGVDGAAYWVHDYNPAGRPVSLQLAGLPGAGSMVAVGPRAESDSAQVNLGLQAVFSGKYTLRLSGQQEFSSGRSQSTGVLSMALNF